MSKEVATRPTGALALASDQTWWTEPQRAALVQLGLEEASPGDLQVFLHQAQRTGLDPFARQIYMIGRRQDGKMKYTIQAAIDGLRIVAERHGQYGGQVGPEWCGEDGQWRDVWVSDKPPLAARVGIIRKDWAQPIYATAMFREYAGTTREGALTRMWREKPAVMIAKCAEALGLRKAFPQDLSGVYTAEEMTQADQSAPPVQPPAPRQEIDWDEAIASASGDVGAFKELWDLARGVDPNNLELAERLAAAGKAAKAAAEQDTAAETPVEVVDAGPVDEPDAEPVQEITAATRAQLTKLTVSLGDLAVKEQNDVHATLSKLVQRPISSRKDLTRDEATQVIELLERCLKGAEPLRKFDAVLASLNEVTP
jgi:phage recombination protein Bet